MTRLLAYRIIPELAALWLLELLALFMTLSVILFAGVDSATDDLAAYSATTYSSSVNRAGLCASVMGAVALGVGLYRADVCADRRRTIIGALLAAVLGWALLVLLVPMARDAGPEATPLVLLRVPATWLAWLTLTRGVLGWALRQRLFTRRVLVLGGGTRAARMAEMIAAHRGGFFEAVTEASLSKRLTPEALRTRRIWAVVLAAEAGTELPRASLLACKQAGIHVNEAAEFCERRLGRIELDAAGQDWALSAHGMSAGRWVSVTRRTADLVISFALLLLTLPLMVLTAILIRMDSPGPVLYRQARTGHAGRIFTLFKFRSMRVDAEAGGRALWASTNDPRVTRVGNVIRRLRIDELPQLFNVLRGEMSFIGPRPERPEFVAELAHEIPLYAHRDCVKPGLTGWAQVSYPYGASVDDARHKLSYDLYYIKHRSALLDLLILIATVRVILFREGAR